MIPRPSDSYSPRGYNHCQAHPISNETPSQLHLRRRLEKRCRRLDALKLFRRDSQVFDFNRFQIVEIDHIRFTDRHPMNRWSHSGTAVVVYLGIVFDIRFQQRPPFLRFPLHKRLQERRRSESLVGIAAAVAGTQLIQRGEGFFGEELGRGFRMDYLFGC
jgi:hypothetical protein